ncbi:MAG: nucleotidyltransferase domain-containing protein [Thermodesulfobacteriota bacterium]
MANDMWIEKFKDDCLPKIIRDVKPVKIFLFGSRVKGNATEDSDIDVILVSNKFDGVPFLKRMEMVLRIAAFPKHVDYLCYTPEEFERIKNSSSIVMDAIENSMEVIL